MWLKSLIYDFSPFVSTARYGYEFLFRGIHDRFGMKIHVSRWKYRMYASVPEILDLLTLDATETWIHACDWRVRLELFISKFVNPMIFVLLY